MSDDISEVGSFEPREYMGMLLIRQLHERPDLTQLKFGGKLGIYEKYYTQIPFEHYLIDDESAHYFLAREELDEEPKGV